MGSEKCNAYFWIFIWKLIFFFFTWKDVEKAFCRAFFQMLGLRHEHQLLYYDWTEDGGWGSFYTKIYMTTIVAFVSV